MLQHRIICTHSALAGSHIETTLDDVLGPQQMR